MTKHHLILISYPAQGHLNPMLNLAKLLHSKDFFITFIVTEFTYNRLVRSRGPQSLLGLDGFRFKTITDGLPPPTDPDTTQDIPSLSVSLRKHCPGPLKDLVKGVNEEVETPSVSSIIADGGMSFAVSIGEELEIPVMVFATHSGCGFLGYFSFDELVKRGYSPLKDEGFLTNGYLDTPIDCIPGMKNMRIRDFPTFIRTTDPDDAMLNIMIKRKGDALNAHGIILNTFEDLEADVLSSIQSKNPNLYAIGPLSPLCRHISSPVGSNLLKEDARCLNWLDKQNADSVIYVNFGSITVITGGQLEEFAWGLAGSMQPFLWVIRPYMVKGGDAKLSDQFVKEVEGRGVFANWCNQEDVLAHKSVGGFLTHCGWNSTLESIYEGVPMICWPFFAEQHMNCRYACAEWGIGMEIDGDVRRERVEKLIRELMGGEKGRDMRKRAMECKEKARKAIEPGGSSYGTLERLLEDLVHMKGV